MLTIILSSGATFNQNNFVTAIKGLRTITGLGLNEAKDIIEAVRDGETRKATTSYEVGSVHFKEGTAMLQSAGIRVRNLQENTESRKAIKEELQRLVTYTMMSDDYDITQSLIGVLELHFADISFDGDEDAK